MVKTTWRKSKRCAGQGACVEVAATGPQRAVRDSALGDASPVLVMTPQAFQGLLRDVRGM